MHLHFQQFGNGWPMIIIHGLYGSSDNWISIAKMLEKHFSIFLIDLRNHGSSFHSNEHTYDKMALDVYEFIESKKIYHPIIVGHSMGGRVAMKFGLLFPQKVQKMVIIDISPLHNSNNSKKHLIEHKNILSALQKLPLDRLQTRKEASLYLSESILSEPVRNFLLKNLAREGKQFRWKLNLDIIATSINHIMEGFSLENPEHLNQTQYPILFIKGNNSDYIEKEDVIAIERFYPQAEIVAIENAGHWVHAEQPSMLIQAIKKFCTNEIDFN